MVGRPIRKARSGRRTHTESESGRGSLLKVQNWSGDATGGPEVGGVASRRSGSGRGTFLKVRKWSGDHPGGPGMVGGPFRRSRSGRGTLPEVWKW